MEEHSNDEPLVEMLECESLDDKRNEIGRKYDLLNEPLYRLVIYKEPTAAHLYMDFHHIVFDGMSFANFSKELSAAYAGESLVPEGKDGFTIAIEEEELRKTEAYTKAKAWHEQEFGGASEVDSLPRPDVYDVEDGKWVFAFHTLKTKETEVEALCEKHGVSVSIPFTAAFGYTLANFSADEEALYTTVFHGRGDKATRNAFTMMVKTLAIYHDFRKTPTVSELLQQTKTQMSGTRKRTVYSFGELHQDLGIEPRVCFAYQGTLHTLNIALDGHEQAGDDLRLHRPGLDFTVHVIQKGDGYECKVEYNESMYSAAFVEQFCKSYSMDMPSAWMCVPLPTSYPYMTTANRSTPSNTRIW